MGRRGAHTLHAGSRESGGSGGRGGGRGGGGAAARRQPKVLAEPLRRGLLVALLRGVVDVVDAKALRVACIPFEVVWQPGTGRSSRVQCRRVQAAPDDGKASGGPLACPTQRPPETPPTPRTQQRPGHVALQRGEQGGAAAAVRLLRAVAAVAQGAQAAMPRAPRPDQMPAPQPPPLCPHSPSGPHRLPARRQSRCSGTPAGGQGARARWDRVRVGLGSSWWVGSGRRQGTASAPGGAHAVLALPPLPLESLQLQSSLAL